MSRIFFKQTAVKGLLVVGLLAGAMAVGTVPAVGQMRTPGQFTFTSAQQALYTLATGLSPYEQRLVVNALVRLGPQRANAELTELAQMNLVIPGSLSLVGPRIITPALQTVPTQYHQLFIDGLLSVTPTEEHYAVQVLSRLVQVRQMQGDPRFSPEPFQASPPSMGTGNSASEQPSQMDIWRQGNRMREDMYRLFSRGQNMNPGLNMPD